MDVEMKQKVKDAQEEQERLRRGREVAELERQRGAERLARAHQEEQENRKRQAEAERARRLEEERKATLERVTQQNDVINLERQRLSGAGDLHSFNSLFGDA